MGNDIIYFDFLTLISKYGKKGMNQRLLEVARAQKPDLMFSVLFTTELEYDTIGELSQNSETTTVNWFADDHWRFDNFSRFWAPSFDWSITTSNDAMGKYDSIGYRNVIKSQWACNHFLYKKLNLPYKYDLTFVGQPHSNRRQVIENVRRQGVPINVWGTGWESGRISQEELICVFNQSRINLNLSNASMSLADSKVLGLVPQSLLPVIARLPFKAKSQLKSIASHVLAGRIDAGGKAGYSTQIKGRNFEVPGCGGFLLSGPSENLEDYYEVGKEVVCFDGERDLLQKSRYYLKHQEEREAIAAAGHSRTLREHTYVHRFDAIFRRVGLPSPSESLILNGEISEGSTTIVV
ncbi:MAG: glycosyltransferase [Nitrososphaerales archaeon]